MGEVEFDKKIKLMSVMYSYRNAYGWALAVFNTYDVALPLAFLHDNGIVDVMSEAGRKLIEECFAGIQESLNLTPERVDLIILASTTMAGAAFLGYEE